MARQTQLRPRSGVTLGRVVALTGASDFIGTGVIRHVEHSGAYRRALALDVHPPEGTLVKTEFVPLDLTQPSAQSQLLEILSRERVDTMVHLAFLSNPTHNSSWAHELEAIGTLYVVNACAARGVQKLVMWSHTCAYGADPLNPNFLSEEHPLHGNPRSRFVSDKVEAERQVGKLAHQRPDMVATVLRTCSIVGPTVHNALTRYFSRRFVPKLMGFDPLLQFVHEDDVLEAFRIALDEDHPGAFNIVGEGVLPLSTAVKLAGRVAVPVPHFLAYPIVHALWTAQAVEAPAAFLDYLRYQWVADGTKARREMGFSPRYGSREAFLAFVESVPRRAQAAEAA
jgi:UDP-glucose 4-epimerase